MGHGCEDFAILGIKMKYVKGEEEKRMSHVRVKFGFWDGRLKMQGIEVELRLSYDDGVA